MKAKMLCCGEEIKPNSQWDSRGWHHVDFYAASALPCPDLGYPTPYILTKKASEK